jgi:hypothetical protein
MASMIAASAACDVEGPSPAPESVEHVQQPINGGYFDATDTSTVGIYDDSIGGICTGSLLTPNMVLTARHCVSNILNEVQGGVDCSKTTAGAPHKPSAFYVLRRSSTDYDWARLDAVFTPLVLESVQDPLF